MYRTSWMNGQPVKVKVEYGVSGNSHDAKFPYVNNIGSLREAVAIAKTYQGTNTPVGAGRIKRNIDVYYPDGKGCLSWMTHEWYVHEDGRIELSEWGGHTNRRKRSPGNSLADAIEADAKEAELMRQAALRDTKDLTPEAYNSIAQTILSCLIRSGRMAGFRVVYFHTPEFREKGEKFLIDEINFHLAHRGFRTLDPVGFREVMKGIQTLDSDIACGVIELGRSNPKVAENER